MKITDYSTLKITAMKDFEVIDVRYYHWHIQRSSFEEFEAFEKYITILWDGCEERILQAEYCSLVLNDVLDKAMFYSFSRHSLQELLDSDYESEVNGALIKGYGIIDEDQYREGCERLEKKYKEWREKQGNTFYIFED